MPWVRSHGNRSDLLICLKSKILKSCAQRITWKCNYLSTNHSRDSSSPKDNSVRTIACTSIRNRAGPISVSPSFTTDAEPNRTPRGNFTRTRSSFNTTKSSSKFGTRPNVCVASGTTTTRKRPPNRPWSSPISKWSSSISEVNHQMIEFLRK